MTMSIHQCLCLADNYGVLVHDSATGATACVDVPEAGPTLAALTERGWNLTDILITHHHADHIQGVPDLKAKFPEAKIWGPAKDKTRIPFLDRELK
jgi:hydroxyacylglutathione hydrolase